MVVITWRDTKRAPWISEQTKVEDIAMTNKDEKLICAGHIMRITDNRWTVSNVETHKLLDVDIKVEHLSEQDGKGWMRDIG